MGHVMTINEITGIKPKTPAQLQVAALKKAADQAAHQLKLVKQQKRLTGIQKSLAKIHSSS